MYYFEAPAQRHKEIQAVLSCLSPFVCFSPSVPSFFLSVFLLSCLSCLAGGVHQQIYIRDCELGRGYLEAATRI